MKRRMQVNNRQTSKRAVIYARVSSDEQAYGYSLPTQLEACRKFATERGNQVVAEFKEDYTGMTLDRPDLNKLRDLILRDSISLIIVYDLDRLARKAIYQGILEEEFSRKGVMVEYVNGQYANTDEGRLQKQIKASIAEYERAKILERSRRGTRGKAQSGYVVVACRPPYGYTLKSEPHKSWLEIDESEARIVQLIYRLYLQGDEMGGPLSMRAIAARLTQMHLLTRGDQQKLYCKKRASGVWHPNVVRSILTNETYTGVWHYGKTKIIHDGFEVTAQAPGKYRSGKKVACPRDQWIAVDVPAMIDPATFKRARERMRLNAEQSKRNTKRQYLLARRIRCMACGLTFLGHTHPKGYQYYFCSGLNNKPRACNTPKFRVDIVDPIVWEWLKGLMKNPKEVIDGLRLTQLESERADDALRERLTIVDSQRTETENQLGKLLDLYLSGNFPKELLNERKAQLEKFVADLTREHEELVAHIQNVSINDEQVNLIESFCNEVSQGIDHATFEDKRRYYDRLDLRVKLAIENGEKIIYVKCRIGEKRLPIATILPREIEYTIMLSICQER